MTELKSRYVVWFRWQEALGKNIIIGFPRARNDAEVRKQAAEFIEKRNKSHVRLSGLRCNYEVVKIWEVAREVPCTEEEALHEYERILRENAPRVADFINGSVEELELSVRTYNCLKNANIRTVREMLKMSESELLRVKNMGRKCIIEIQEILMPLGLKLGLTNKDLALLTKVD